MYFTLAKVYFIIIFVLNVKVKNEHLNVTQRKYVLFVKKKKERRKGHRLMYNYYVLHYFMLIFK